MADLQEICINGDCSQLPDPDDYYDKTEVDNLVDGATLKNIVDADDGGVLINGKTDIENPNFPDSQPISDYYGIDYAYRLVDASGNIIGYVQPTYTAYGRGVDLGASRDINGSTYYNSLRLELDSAGNPIVKVTRPAAWRSELELKPTAMSTTYTANSYVNATSFGRISVYNMGYFYNVIGNLSITTNMPTTAADIEIGRISNYSALNTILINVPNQAGAGVLMISISTRGVITIQNRTPTTINASEGWCRFTATVPKA